jgi:hypothetical protein
MACNVAVEQAAKLAKPAADVVAAWRRGYFLPSALNDSLRDLAAAVEKPEIVT